MNSRFELIKDYFKADIDKMILNVEEFYAQYADIKDFKIELFIEEILNAESINDVCPIAFGVKCQYISSTLCNNCSFPCKYGIEILHKSAYFKVKISNELEALYDKVRDKVQFKKFFP